MNTTIVVNAIPMSSENTFQTAVLHQLERIALAVEKPRGELPNSSKETQAMVWVAATQNFNKSHIANEFSVSLRTVQRWKKLCRLIDGLTTKKSPGSVNQGAKDSEGSIEAW